MSWFISFPLAFFILGLQHFLSTRKKAFWGAILPILYALLLIYLKTSGQLEVNREFWFIAVLGTVILLGGWASGRESLKKKRIKELEKIEKMNL